MSMKPALPLVLSVVFLLMCQLLTVSGQTPPPDFFRSASGRARSAQETEAVRKAYYHQKQMEAKTNEYRTGRSRTQGSPAAKAEERERKRAIEALVKPSNAERKAYKDLLQSPNAGIFTLLNWDTCEKSSPKVVEEHLCVDPLPGNAGRYSFRQRSYVPFGFSDLGLHDNWLIGFGIATQTIMVDLGDVPITEVDLNRPDLRFLTDFVPSSTIEGAENQSAELGGGIEKDGRLFFNAVKATVNHTYVIRSIAYRGKLLVVVRSGEQKFEFDRLRNDSREDVIVAFRVVSVGEDGRTRILWRKLKSRESPILDLPVTEIDGSQVRRKITIVN